MIGVESRRPPTELNLFDGISPNEVVTSELVDTSMTSVARSFPLAKPPTIKNRLFAANIEYFCKQVALYV